MFPFQTLTLRPHQYDAAVHAVLKGLYRLLGSCAVRSDPAILRAGEASLCGQDAEDKSGPHTFPGRLRAVAPTGRSRNL